MDYDGTRLHELFNPETGEVQALCELTDDDRRKLNRELEGQGKRERWVLYDTWIYY